MNMSMDGSTSSSMDDGVVQNWQWAQSVWPDCRNLTILGPNTPQAPPEDVMNASYVGHDDYNDMEIYAKICNGISLALIASAIIPGLIHRWRKKQPVQSYTFFTSTVLGRTYLTLLAAFRLIGYRTSSFSFGRGKGRRFYLPQANHLIVIAAVWISLYVWNLSTRPYYRCLREWGAPPLATRSSMMIVSFFPFLFTLGSKFNLISIVTNISYERLQVYHRWLARLILALSLTHLIPMFVQPYMEGGASLVHLYYYTTADENYLMYWSGTVCFCLLVWMVVSSTNVLRNLSYEFFVVQHVLSILIFLVIFFIHAGNMLNSWLWLWPTIGLWGFAVLVRMLRGALASDFFVGKYALLETEKRDIQINNEEQKQDPLVRITVRTPVRWAPGQHILLHFPSLGFMQPHPFTVTTLPDADRPNFESTAVFVARARGGLTRTLYDLAQKGNTLECIDKNSISSEEKNDTIIKNPKRAQATIPVSVDGPYGTNASMASYDGILLVAGGSGFSVIISVLQDLAIKVIRQPEQVATKRVFIHWSIRTMSTFDWMKEQLDRCVEILREKGKIDVQVQITITRSASQDDQNAVQLPTYARCTFGQRALIDELCTDVIKEMASESIRSMSCVVCGPMEMGLQSQNAIRQAQMKILRGQMGSILELYMFKSNFYW